MEKYDIENLKKRAEQGDTYAMLYLGNIYRFGKDGIEPDAEKAFALYEMRQRAAIPPAIYLWVCCTKTAKAFCRTS